MDLSDGIYTVGFKKEVGFESLIERREVLFVCLAGKIQLANMVFLIFLFNFLVLTLTHSTHCQIGM